MLTNIHAFFVALKRVSEPRFLNTEHFFLNTLYYSAIQLKVSTRISHGKLIVNPV